MAGFHDITVSENTETTMSKTVAGIILLLLCSHLLSAAVDCRNPSTRQQRVVCANPELMDLDRQLSILYQKALTEKSGFERQELENYQRSWEDSSGGCWDRVDCIKKRYMDRLAALEAVIAKASVPKPIQPSAVEPTTPKASPAFQDSLNGPEARNQVRVDERLTAKAAFEVANEVLRLEQKKIELVRKLNDLRGGGEVTIQPELDRLMEARNMLNRSALYYGNFGPKQRAEAEATKARSEELQSQIAAMTQELASRQKRFDTRAFAQGRQVLEVMRKRAASAEFKSLKGTMANSSNQLNIQCDQLAAALDKGNLQEIVSLTNGVRNLGDTLEKTRVDSLRAEANRANELARQKAVMSTATGKRVYDGCYAWAKRQGLIAGTQVRVFKDEETNKAAEMATNPGEPLCRCVTVQVAGNNEITDAAKLEIGHIMETQNKAGPGPLGIVVSAAMGQCYDQSFKNMVGR